MGQFVCASTLLIFAHLLTNVLHGIVYYYCMACCRMMTRIKDHRSTYVRSVALCSVVLCAVCNSLMMFYMLEMGGLPQCWTVGQE